MYIIIATRYLLPAVCYLLHRSCYPLSLHLTCLSTRPALSLPIHLASHIATSLSYLIMPAGATLTSKYYRQAVDFWQSPAIEVVSMKGNQEETIARIPLEFVRRGGNDTWSYVIEVIKELVDQKDGHIFYQGHAVDPAMAPFPGIFFYVPSSESLVYELSRMPDHELIVTVLWDVASSSITFARGPTSTTFAKPADADGSESNPTSGLSNKDQVSSLIATRRILTEHVWLEGKLQGWGVRS
jgi:hypothetical protein